MEVPPCFWDDTKKLNSLWERVVYQHIYTQTFVPRHLCLDLIHGHLYLDINTRTFLPSRLYSDIYTQTLLPWHWYLFMLAHHYLDMYTQTFVPRNWYLDIFTWTSITGHLYHDQYEKDEGSSETHGGKNYGNQCSRENKERKTVV